MNDEEQEQIQQPDGGADAAQESAADAAAIKEAKALYEDLGIKAPVPTGKAKGRPKASGVRAKDSASGGAGDAAPEPKEDGDDKNKSKNAPSTAKDGGTGDGSDSASTQKRSDAGQVPGEPEGTGAGVRSGQPESEEDAERGDTGDSDPGDKRDGQEEDEQGVPSEEGKRPGKSNPKVEQRFQKMTNDLRERDEALSTQAEYINRLEQQLNEAVQARQEAKVASEDPEYTIEDFRKVRDEQGNVHELDEDQAELAWRRWQDGHNERKAAREAEQNYRQSLEKQQQTANQRLMESSAAAYDTLASLADKFPELSEDSDKFDQQFASKVMPLLRSMLIYQPGTENNEKPVVVGLRMNPLEILNVIRDIRKEKRDLPLNGIHDSVESSPGISVQHSRSSDPDVRQANELYASLGIKKRL